MNYYNSEEIRKASELNMPKESRLPTVETWTERTSYTLAYRLAELASKRPALYNLFRRILNNLKIHND